VISGQITLDQAFDEFLKNFTEKFGQIEKREWDDYYAAVSFNLDNDDHFNYLIRDVWQLD
jgi:predicted component of type VI protein secretion system